MRKTSALIALILVTLSVRCQSEETVLQHARKLVELKHYNSAYVFLDSIDPHNSVPELALFKADICLDYFVSSIMHQVFALKDLEESEDVYDYRGKEGVYSLHAFSIDSTLIHLIGYTGHIVPGFRCESLPGFSCLNQQIFVFL